MSELIEVKRRDYSLLTKPNRESAEILLPIFTPRFLFAIPEPMPRIHVTQFIIKRVKSIFGIGLPNLIQEFIFRSLI